MWRTVAVLAVLSWGVVSSGANADEQAAELALPSAATAPPLPPVEAVAEQMTAIEADFSRLSALPASSANEFRQRLDALKDRLRPDYRPASSDKLELHMVGVHEGVLRDTARREASVRVTHTGARVILCLCAYNPVEWHLDVGPNVQLAQVIVSGYEPQTLVGAPQGVPVAIYTPTQSGESLGYAYARARADSDDSFPALAAALLDKTNLPVMTMQGDYTAPKSDIIVGPESAAWRSELVRDDVAALAAEVAKVRRTALWKDFNDLKFSALRSEGRRPGGPGYSFGRYSLAGPLLDTHQAIPRQAQRVSMATIDPKRPTHYVWTSEGLVRLELGAGDNRYIQVGEGDREWPGMRGLTFDTRRRRVVLASGGDRKLFRYEPDANRWLPPVALEDSRLDALAYHEDQDKLFALVIDHSGELSGLQLLRFDAEGKQEDRRSIKGLRDGYVGRFGGNLQLAAAGKHLVVLIEHRDRRRLFGPNHGPTVSNRAYVIDPASAEVVFSSSFGAQPELAAQPKPDVVGHLAPVPTLLKQPTWEDTVRELPRPAVHRNAANGHYYEFLSLNRSIPWTEARLIAGGRTYEGRTGYLATITSPEESDFLAKHFGSRGSAWIGATDEEQEGEWKWVTGPEAGTLFWRGTAEGEATGFHKWGRSENLNEPNNCVSDGLGENFCVWNWSRGEENDPGYWNDVRGEWFESNLLIEFSDAPAATGNSPATATPPANEQDAPPPAAPE